MKFISQLILTLLFSWLLQSFLPWWSAVISSFLIGIIISGNKSFHSFFAGFLAIFLLWVGYALVIDITSQSILTEKIAHILTINNKYILIFITGIIGGIPAGFGGLSGNLLRKTFKNNRTSKYYS